MENTVLRLLDEIIQRGRADGLRQKTIVERAGLGASTLSKAKSARDLRVTTLERMANVVGMRIVLVPNDPVLEKLLDRSLLEE